MSGRRILIERYADEFDFRGGGGIETAGFHLAHALERGGTLVDWYTPADGSDPLALAARIFGEGYTALFPLVESAVFRTPSLLGDATRRTVRIWHDVGVLAAPRTPLPGCPVHGRADDAEHPIGPTAACIATVVDPGACAADIVFSDEPWTRCFPRRRCIPWAVDHLPRAQHHDPAGPVVLLAGKAPLAAVRAIAAAARQGGSGVRIVFSQWTGLGREAKQHFFSAGRDEADEVIDHYDLMQDHRRVFGGASAALVLSHYRETFSFLAAEAVHFGIPVVAPIASGAALRFAAARMADEAAVATLVRSGGHRRLSPVPSPTWGWADVAAAYVRVLDDIEAEHDEPARRTAVAEKGANG